jgi:glucose/arabinose dehydrogenase
LLFKKLHRLKKINKVIFGKIIFVILIFSIFTSVNNLVPLKNSFGVAVKVNPLVMIKQKQENNKSQSLSSLGSSFKNITLSHGFTIKINQGNPPQTNNFNISKGYKIEPVLWNLDLPGAITFDNKGNMYIAESGSTVGGLTTHPRILKLDHQTGNLTILTDRSLAPPIVDIKFYQGQLYVSNAGKISVVDPIKGTVQDIVAGLPAGGDHKTNQIAFGPKDGRLYFSQGSATNSGVVGIDNYLPDLGWLADAPQIHDVPAKSITLTEKNFTTPNILAPGPKNISSTGYLNGNFKVKVTSVSSKSKSNDNNSGNYLANVTTGAFKSYGNSTAKGEKIKGNLFCTACILSTKPDGTDLKVVAWGIRDPEGLAFDKEGKLVVTVQGDDERGSRPIANDHDRIYKIDVSNTTGLGKFYGWPDYAFAGGKENETMPVTNPIFHSNKDNQPLSLLLENPPPVEKKVFADAGWGSIVTQAVLSNNNSADNTSTSISDSNISNNKFGFDGKIFFVERGSYAPITKTSSSKGQMTSVFGDHKSIIGQVIPGTNHTIGQKIVMLNTKNGKIDNFISIKKPDPTFRPIGIAFNNDANAMYIASIGKQEVKNTLPSGVSLPIPETWVYQHTGIIWKVTKNPSSPSTIAVPTASVQKQQKIMPSPKDFNVSINSGNPPLPTNQISIKNGYKIEPVLWNLELPVSVAFDNKENMYIAESGLNYGGLFTPPQILKMDHKTGNLSIFVDRGLSRPLLHIDFHNGKLYATNGGKISTIDMNGVITNIVSGLPALGDHWVDGTAFGTDKRMYFGVGVATNTGIVNMGRDNPWAKTYPTFHDVPCKDVTLTGNNHVTDYYFEPQEKNKSAITGAYVPFNTTTSKGELIKGGIKPYEGVWPGYGCSGSLLSTKDDGSDIQLVGWGFRHLIGFTFNNSDRNLIVSMNGMDERGSRPIAHDTDKIYSIDIANHSNWGKWYGWPDYINYGEPVTNPEFKSAFEIPKNNNTIQFLMQNHPPVVIPSLLLKIGAAVGETKLINSSSKVGFNGKILMAEYGTLAPQTHLTADSPFQMYIGGVMGQAIGQDIQILDPKTFALDKFIGIDTANAAFRPFGIQFGPDGKTLYIASVGKDEARLITPNGVQLPFTIPWSIPSTGSIWKVTKID